MNFLIDKVAPVCRLHSSVSKYEFLPKTNEVLTCILIFQACNSSLMWLDSLLIQLHNESYLSQAKEDWR